MSDEEELAELRQQRPDQFRQKRQQYEDPEIGPPIPQDDDIGPPIPQDLNQNNYSTLDQIENENGNVGPPVPTNLNQNSSGLNDQSIDIDVGPPIPQDLKFGPPRPQNVNNNNQQNKLNHSNTIRNNGIYKNSTIGPSENQNLSFGPPRPQQLDKQNQKNQSEQNIDQISIDDEDDDDDDGDDNNEDDNGILEDDKYQLPISHDIVLQGHTKMVSALDIDRPGGRLISGSHDYDILMYDFNGMKSDFKFFRQITPYSGYPINALSYSPSGDCFLCVTGNSQAKIYDRDGRELGETVKGDMYIRDMKNTKGHVSAMTSGAWHPTDTGQCLTCGEDGTLRLFDTFRIEQKTVIKPKLSTTQRVAVTACAFNFDGSLIAGGLRDGQIQIWSSNQKQGGKFGTSAAIPVVLPPMPQMVQQQKWSYVATPNQVQKQAHTNGENITSLKFSYDNKFLASRSMDGSLGIWDTRSIKQPLKMINDLPTSIETTQISFSPTGELLLTGYDGGLVFYNTQTFEVVQDLKFEQRIGVINWHPRINQIAIGQANSDFRSKQHNDVRVLYSPKYSQHGALFCVGKNPKPREDFAINIKPTIVNPHALPLFREGYSRKRKKEKEQMDAVKTKKPEGGDTIGGMGKGGRLGTTGGTLLTQYLMKERGELKSVAQERDPREAILRHKTEGDQYNIYTKAYQQTQPERIYHKEDKNQDDEEDEET